MKLIGTSKASLRPQPGPQIVAYPSVTMFFATAVIPGSALEHWKQRCYFFKELKTTGLRRPSLEQPQSWECGYSMHISSPYFILKASLKLTGPLDAFTWVLFCFL